MADIVIKTIQATDELLVSLIQDRDPREGSYISIRHTPTPRDMPGEIIFSPGQVPDLVQAITEAALKLTLLESLATGTAPV